MSNGKEVKSALTALGIVSVVWGTTWVASRQGVIHMPALQLAGIRQIIAGFAFLAFYIPGRLRVPKGQEWYPIIILAFLNFLISNGLSTWGVTYISSGLGAIIGSIYPFWLVLIGMLLFRKLPSPLTIAGMLLGVAGICMVFYTHLEELFLPSFRFGIVLSIIATISWAAGTIYTKSHANAFPPYQSIGYQMLLSGIVLYLIASYQGMTIPLDAITWQSWSSIGYLVIIGSFLGFGCYLYALQHLSPEEVSVYAYINPIIAILTGGLFFDEKLDFIMLMGTLVAITGVYIVNRSYRQI